LRQPPDAADLVERGREVPKPGWPYRDSAAMCAVRPRRRAVFGLEPGGVRLGGNVVGVPFEEDTRRRAVPCDARRAEHAPPGFEGVGGGLEPTREAGTRLAAQRDLHEDAQ